MRAEKTWNIKLFPSYKYGYCLVFLEVFDVYDHV